MKHDYKENRPTAVANEYVYTGNTITIPAHSIAFLSAACTYSNNMPISAKIITSDTDPDNAGCLVESSVIGVVVRTNGQIMTDNDPIPLSLWAKWDGSSTNFSSLDAKWYELSTS